LYQTNKFEEAFEIVKNFDRTTQSYISWVWCSFRLMRGRRNNIATFKSCSHG
jgi:hypothetical protein